VVQASNDPNFEQAEAFLEVFLFLIQDDDSVLESRGARFERPKARPRRRAFSCHLPSSFRVSYYSQKLIFVSIL
jgi:hypothetical protein